MVTVQHGRATLCGSTTDLAIDIITFLGSINSIKEEYEHYKALEVALRELCKENRICIDVIKEFGFNMTEIFN